MNELYQLVEDKIKAAGYQKEISGAVIYDEICNFIEDKENGTYIFLSKHDLDQVFEYKIDVMEDSFNLSYITITSPEENYHIDFDA